MRGFGLFVLWCLLLVFCWPVALVAVVLFPVVWLMALPFRLVGIAVESALALVRAVLMMPARVVAWPFRGGLVRA
jgi:hypothetical protein